MNRLKQKCIIGMAGFHLLLLLTILIAGSGFFERKPKIDDSQILTVIPANLIDASFNSGIKGAVAPPPAPVQPPKPQSQQVTPTPPKPVAPVPAPSLLDQVKDMFKTQPAKPVKPTPTEHKIAPNLQKTTRTAAKPVANPAVQKTIRNLQKNLSKATEINLSGNSSVAYANYATVVRSIFDGAWVLPDNIAKNENIEVKVTIASDGTVISSRIVTPSGDQPADDSVQKALDRVQFVAPFPEGTTDKERTYTIVFNPQVKSTE